MKLKPSPGQGGAIVMFILAAATLTLAQTPVGIGYVTTSTYSLTPQNWSQALSNSLTAGSPGSLKLSPCPAGVDTTSGAGYQVYISDPANSEAVSVLANGAICSGGSITISFTPYFSHTPGTGVTVGSASSGIQETINTQAGLSATTSNNSYANITIPGTLFNYSNLYSVYGTIYFHGNQSVLSGYGATLECYTRGPCLQIGDLGASTDYTSNTVNGLIFRSAVPTVANPSLYPAYVGSLITQTQTSSSNVATITTATAHGFRVGDMVTILYTDNTNYWGDVVITAVPSSTTFQYVKSGPIAAQTTPGIVALAYDAILDNSTGTHFNDITLDLAGEYGEFNEFFDLWDDENVTIEHVNGSGGLNANQNWVGSWVFSAGNHNHPGHQNAPVISLRDSSFTGTNPCVTVLNSNGVYVENTVCQSSQPWQWYISNVTGNYQGAYIKNGYSESNASANPVSPAHSPWPGMGVAGAIFAGGNNYQLRGNTANDVTGNGISVLPSGSTAGGTINYTYYIVVHDTTTTTATGTAPMPILNYTSNGSDHPVVSWPRVANGTDTITYDVLRGPQFSFQPQVPFPYPGGCQGGTYPTNACGSVATGLAQCSGFICSYTDNGGGNTSAYSFSSPWNYSGPLAYWPGAIVAQNSPIQTDTDIDANLTGVALNGGPMLIADFCPGFGATSPGGYTQCKATTPNNNSPNQAALLVQDGGATGGATNQNKGKLNFTNDAGSYPQEIITLIDSNPWLTRATQGFRPPWNAQDMWIGSDIPLAGGSVGNYSNLQMAFGASYSISSYIAQLPNSTGGTQSNNWLERLTANVKTFKVPIQTPSATITLNTTAIAANTCSVQSTTALPGLTAGSVVKWSWASTPIGVTGYGTGGLQISTFANSSGAANVVVCNITGSAITPGPMTLNLRGELYATKSITVLAEAESAGEVAAPRQPMHARSFPGARGPSRY